MTMFKELKRIWEEQKFTSTIVEEFSSMLEYSEEMLSYALKVLTTKSKAKKFSNYVKIEGSVPFDKEAGSKESHANRK